MSAVENAPRFGGAHRRGRRRPARCGGAVHGAPGRRPAAPGVIAAHPELRERELIKLASVAAAVAEALRRRGVGEPTASLTAEAGMAVFRIAFERWITETAPNELTVAHPRVTQGAARGDREIADRSQQRDQVLIAIRLTPGS